MANQSNAAILTFIHQALRRIDWRHGVQCLLVLGMLAGCGGGGGSSENTSTAQAPTVPPSNGTFALGGAVKGLQSQGLVLQTAGQSDLSIQAGAGTFRFAKPLPGGSPYNITVKSQPAGAICTVSNGRGTVVDRDPLGIVVTCSSESHALGGNVSGLKGSSLVLQVNGGNDVTITANGAFRFAQPLPTGASYSIIVATQPSPQICSVNPASGVIAHQDVANVQVICADQAFTISGTVTGLAGSGLTLQNNGGNDLVLSPEQGSFTFETPVASGAAYNVTVQTQPAQPAQVCAVIDGAAIATTNVSNIAVRCRDAVRFVYFYGTNGISAYSVNARTGELTLSGNLQTSDVRTIAVDDSGTFMYIRLNDSITGFTLDPSTGMPALPIDGMPIATSQSRAFMSVDPGRGNLYDVGPNISRYTVHPDGSLSNRSDSTFSGESVDIASDPNGKFFFVDTVDNVSVFNGGGAPLQPIEGSPFGVPSSPSSLSALTISPPGDILYAVDFNYNKINAFSVDNVTGKLSFLRSSPSKLPWKMRVDPSNVFAYVVNYFGTEIGMYYIESNIGNLLLESSIAAKATTEIQIDPMGEFLFAAGERRIICYRIDSSNGTLSDPKTIDVDLGNLLYMKSVAR